MREESTVRAHLVGSVNLESPEAVFREVAKHAGDVVDRIPDGETGRRINWFEFQVDVLARQPQLEGVGEAAVKDDGYAVFSRFRVRPGVEAEELELGPLGYAEDALASYAVLRGLKEDGTVPAHVRFQVSLPTAVAVTFAYMDAGSEAAFEAAYERHLLREIAAIRSEIPDEELAIQWDVAVEIGMLEGVFPSYLRGDMLGEVTERLGRLGTAIPYPIELGFHLCYGNRGNEHWKEPDDTATMVAIANGVSRTCQRTIDWIHMPVPIERDDDAYFAPLRDLSLPARTELSLGLLHKEDGIDGARRRMAVARRVVPTFHVATECGMGREDRSTIGPLLDLHTEACRDGAVAAGPR
jgi:hypothetical protein